MGGFGLGCGGSAAQTSERAGPGARGEGTEMDTDYKMEADTQRVAGVWRADPGSFGTGAPFLGVFDGTDKKATHAKTAHVCGRLSPPPLD